MEQAAAALGAGDEDGLLGVDALVGEAAGGGDRVDATEREARERRRIDAEVEERAAGQRRVGQALRATGVEGLAVIGEDVLDLTQKTVLEALADDVDAGEEAGPHGLHREQALGLRGVEDVLGLGGVARERLLDEDVLAGVEGEQGLGVVLGVGRGDVDDVEVRVVDEFLIGPVCRVRTELVREGLRSAQVTGGNGLDHLVGLGAQGRDALACDVAGAEDAPPEGGGGARVRGTGSGERRGHRPILAHGVVASGTSGVCRPLAGRCPCPVVSGTAYRGRMRPTTDLKRTVAPFQVVSDFEPAGDQPTAIKDLTERINSGQQNVVLLGATGTGKSATTAWLVEQVQRPTLVMAPNKTLAAQLANEFRELLPNNAVEYFVSYYDYFQPEAYVPQTDTYIEKDSSINDEVERLRHSATNSLLTRRDVIVVASVSCIYGLGTPQEYVDKMVQLRVGDELDRDDLLRRFVQMQYSRNDLAFTRGTFRVRGDTVEIIPMYEELAVRIEFFGDEVDKIYTLHPLTGEIVREETEMYVFPASHYIAGPERMERAIAGIEHELEEQLKTFESQGKLLEAQRLRMRTTYDIEMMRQVGSCSGIENYSMHLDGRTAGSAPNCLLDYFPEDFLLVLDESHVTVPQIGAMYEGDASRKRTLVDHGFRLPSAMDNRPLKWEEFLERIGQTVYLSATPGNYELAQADGVVEQIIRPTGLIDPEIVLKPTKGQIDDLLHEINERAAKNERVLVTTLTKKMAEDLTDYLLDKGVRVRYLHSDIDTLRRVELLRELRMGEYDVLVGINLLREGLDLPEVSLVSILDADKEGFLRSARSLIQTIGRAARNVSGQVHMYADKVTPSMEQAVEETSRRREKQIAYNLEKGVDPQPLRKKIADITDLLEREDADTEALLGSGRAQSRGKSDGGRGGRGALAADASTVGSGRLENLAAGDLANLIQELTTQMHQAAADLHFELAARLRDEVGDLKKELRQMSEGTK